jgi:flagella basal body P-ring formation protein FlgA
VRVSSTVSAIVHRLVLVGAFLIALAPEGRAQQANAATTSAPSTSASIVEANEPKQRVAVTTRALARGTVLTADDFELRDTTLHRPLPGDAPTVTAGWVTRRAFNAGEVLREPAVEAPSVVNANSPVKVEWTDGNVSISIAGIAARNAALGERVPVRTANGRRIEATVVGPGRVRID